MRNASGTDDGRWTDMEERTDDHVESWRSLAKIDKLQCFAFLGKK